MKREKVHSVEKVDVVLLKRNPPVLSISASGQVNTGGWKNPELIIYEYFIPPADGIQDFDFTSEPPSGPVIQQLTPISVTFSWENPPVWLHGIRIHALSNQKEALLNQEISR